MLIVNNNRVEPNMKRYTYSTSDKSFLDVRHDEFWNDTVDWIYHKYPKLTPNQLTLLGGMPVIGIILLHISGILGSIAFPFLAIAIVWYLNMDAMDGKLARHSNRSTPTGQVLDHGLDAMVGGFLTVAMASFLGLFNPFFVAFAVILTTALFYQATLKEHLTGQMIVTMKFYLGKTENTSVVIGTTELLYALSFTLFFGFFTFHGDMIFCVPLGIGLVFILLYLNETLLRMNLRFLFGDSGDASDEEYEEGYGSPPKYREESKVRRRKKAKAVKKIQTRNQIYDANMRPIGSYTGFSLFPQPDELLVDDSDQDNETEEGEFDENKSSFSYSPFSSFSMPNLSKVRRTPYFAFGVTQLVSLIMYLLTFGSRLQLVSMITYITTITIDLIFLNTLRLDRSDKKSQILIKRFSSRNTLIFGVIKIIAYLIGLIGVITGLVGSTFLAFTLAAIVDAFFVMFYAVDLFDKTDIVMSYFKDE